MTPRDYSAFLDGDEPAEKLFNFRNRKPEDIAAFLDSDEDAASFFSEPEQTQPDPMTFTESVGRGVDLAQGLGYGAAEAAGELFGFEGLTEFGREGRERNLGPEMQVYGERTKFDDIDSFGDFAQWAKETAGEQIPMMAPSLAGGAAGAGLGALGGPASPITIPLGAAIGAFVPSLILGTGETQAAIKEKDPEASEPGWALAGGTAIATLDSVVPGRLGTRIMRHFGLDVGEEVAKRILEKPVKENWIKAGAKEGAKSLAIEGITEATQEAISEVAAAHATDTDVDVEGLLSQMREAGAAGMLMGGGSGFVSEAATTPARNRRAQENADWQRRVDEKAAADKAAELARLDAQLDARLAEMDSEASGSAAPPPRDPPAPPMVVTPGGEVMPAELFEANRAAYERAQRARTAPPAPPPGSMFQGPSDDELARMEGEGGAIGAQTPPGRPQSPFYVTPGGEAMTPEQMAATPAGAAERARQEAEARRKAPLPEPIASAIAANQGKTLSFNQFQRAIGVKNRPEARALIAELNARGDVIATPDGVQIPAATANAPTGPSSRPVGGGAAATAEGVPPAPRPTQPPEVDQRATQIVDALRAQGWSDQEIVGYAEALATGREAAAPDARADAAAIINLVRRPPTPPGASPAAVAGTAQERTAPEALQTLIEQQKALVERRSPVMMFPTGTQELPIPEGMKRVQTERGVFHFNPSMINAPTIRRASAEGRENEILGLGSLSKADVAASGERPVAVVERTPSGTEVKAAVTTPSAVDDAAAAVTRGAAPDNTVAVEDPEEVIEARQMAALVEKAKKNTDAFLEQIGMTREEVRALPEQTRQKVMSDYRAFVEARRAEERGDGSKSSPVKVETAEDLDAARERIAEPTEGQKGAGNYQKAHLTWYGLPISIETGKGQARTGTDANGKAWSVTMPADYGYVKRTEGKDGDQVDIYMGPNPQSRRVFIIDQRNLETGKFDEHKVMLGYPTAQAAAADYLAAFSDGRGEQRLGAITPMNVGEFKKWLETGNTKKAVGKFRSTAQMEAAKKLGSAPAEAEGGTDAITFLAARGGIRDDEGHDLKKGRGLQKMTRRGPLIRKTGMSIDAAGEALWDAGYFGPTETTPRPTENMTLEFIEKAHKTKTYLPEMQSQKEEDGAAEQEHARAMDALAAIKAEVEAAGYAGAFPQADLEAAAQIMLRTGLDAAEALDQLVIEQERTAEGDAFVEPVEDDFDGQDPFELGEDESRQARGAPGDGRQDEEAAGDEAQPTPAREEPEGRGLPEEEAGEETGGVEPRLDAEGRSDLSESEIIQKYETYIRQRREKRAKEFDDRESEAAAAEYRRGFDARLSGEKIPGERGLGLGMRAWQNPNIAGWMDAESLIDTLILDDDGIAPAAGNPQLEKLGNILGQVADLAKEIAQPQARSDSSLNRTASWVIKNKETGDVVMETFDRAKVDALNTDKYEAVPIQEHLASLNAPKDDRTPKTEKIDTVEGKRDQFVMPGAERSAKQAAKARGERIKPKAPQKDADEGLFDTGARDQGEMFSAIGDYGGNHRPPGPDNGAPLHDLTGGGSIYPDDIYGPNAAQYYGHFGGNNPLDRSTMAIIQSVRGRPKAKIKIYRAVPANLTNAEKLSKLEKNMARFMARGTVPDGERAQGWYDRAYEERERLRALPTETDEKIKINEGDWVTINRDYAKDHGESALNGDYKIISKTVRADEVFTNGDSIHEFGYWPSAVGNKADDRDLIIQHNISARDQGEMVSAVGTATPEMVSELERTVKDTAGLGQLSLSLTGQGDLRLNMIAVATNKRNAGRGTKAMEMISEFADRHGLRIILSPGLKDDNFKTTSRGRLVKFYKRFGFVENKGRNKDFSIREGMYRTPSVMDQDGAEGFNITRGEAKSMIDRLWGVYRESYENRAAFDALNSFEIGLMLESDYEIYNRYLKNLPEDISAKDVVDAYRAGSLPESKAAAERTSALNVPKDVDAPYSGLMGEPKPRPRLSPSAAREAWKSATQRRTPSNAQEVDAARYSVFIEFNSDAASFVDAIGEPMKSLTAKMRSWSNYPASALKVEGALNEGRSTPTQWTGISNSAYLARQQVSPSDVDKFVAEVSAPDSSWNTPDAESIRRYIVRAFLAIDTRISYADLKFRVESALKPLGQFAPTSWTITMRANSAHTLAHEVGHYLDYKWAAEAAPGISVPASEIIDTYRADIIEKNTSPERLQWLRRYHEFIMDISDRSDIGSAYLQRRTEVFARFVDAFVRWTNKQAGIREYQEQRYYSDRFNEGDFRRFVKLLQEKAYVDIKDGNPNAGAKSSGTTVDDEYSAASDAAPFFSALTRAVEGMKQPKAPASQWMSMIRKAPGVKAEEIEWSGVEQWLASMGDDSIARDKLVEFLRANEIKVDEVVRGGPGSKPSPMVWDEMTPKSWEDNEVGYSIRETARNEYTLFDPFSGNKIGSYTTLDQAKGAADVHLAEQNESVTGRGDDGTKFSKFTLPGGENYRELLLTLPVKEDEIDISKYRTFKDSFGDYQVIFNDRFVGNPVPASNAESAIRIAVMRQRKEKPSYFKSGHFDEPNIVAHVRFNEREDADGKRVLFIEEIQSDWHQSGRKSGYSVKPEAKYEQYNSGGIMMWEIRDKNSDVFYQNGFPTKEAAATWWDTEGRDVWTKSTGIPNAPFKTTWQELAFKRALRWAVENGFDRVAWTTGDQQVTRYAEALRKQVDRIEWEKTPDGIHIKGIKGRSPTEKETTERIRLGLTGNLTPHQRARYNELNALRGPITVVDTVEKESAISDAIGKSMGDRIIESPDSSGVIEGDEITVSDTGMAGFYDKILPRFVNRYVKKWGAKAEKLKFRAGPKEGSDNWVNVTIDEFPDGTARVNADGFETTYDTVAEAEAAREAYLGRMAAAHSVDITPDMRDSIMQGQPLFRGDVDNFKPGIDRKAVERNVRDIIAEVSGGKANVTFEDVMFGQGEALTESGAASSRKQQVAGSYNSLARLIRVSMSGIADPIKTGLHEVFHDLQKWGAFTPDEQRALQNSVTRMKEIARTEGLNPEGMSQNELEAVAFAFVERKRMNEESVAGLSPALRRAFAKVRAILDRIKRFLSGNGWTTIDDVFQRARSGEIAQRGDVNAQPASARISYSGNEVTKTPAFKRWFGGSKVVDADGRPKVVYKGMYPYDWTKETAASRGPEIESINRTTEFPAFNGGEPGVDIAGFFGDRATASRFADAMGEGAVYPVYLKIENPYVIEASGRKAGEIQFGESGKEFRQAITSGKYDGVIINDTPDEGTIYVALNPTQIKSVHNRGTFDPKDPRISYSTAGGAQAPILYHVTFKNRLPAISKKGLSPFGDGTSNWKRGNKRHQESPAVFAFDNPAAALRWAKKMAFDFRNEDKDADISIIAIKNNGGWQADKTADPNLQLYGNSLQREIGVAPNDIVGTVDLKSMGSPRRANQSFDEWLMDQASKLEQRFSPSEQYSVTTLDAEATPEYPSETKDIRSKDVQNISKRIRQGNDAEPVMQRVRRAVREFKEEGARRLLQGVADTFYAVDQLERTQNAGQLLDASKSAYKATRMTQNITSVMSYVLRHGPIQLKDGGFSPVEGHKFKGGFQGIFTNVLKAGEMELFKDWIIAQRAGRLLGEGRENLLTADEIAKIKAEVSKDAAREARFMEAFKNYQDFNGTLLDMAVATGRVSAKQADLWRKNGDYVPFYRLMEGDDVADGPKKTRGLSQAGKLSERLKGGRQRLGDPIENMVMNMTAMVDKAMKNEALRRVVDMGIEAGMMAKAEEAENVLYTDKQISEMLEKNGIKLESLPAAEQEKWIKMLTAMVHPPGNAVTLWRNGTPERYHVYDPLLLKAVSAMTPVQLGTLMKLMRGAKRVLTEGVTMSPAFMAANLMRDTLSSWAISGQKGLNPFVGAPRGLVKAWKEDPSILAIQAAGGGTAGFYGIQPEDIRKQIDDKLKGVDRNRVVNTVKKAWELWHRIGATTEQANRIAIYDQVKKNGGTDAEAAYQALDIMDFSLRGDYAAVRMLVEMIPFLNARIQGLYRLYRGAVKGAPTSPEGLQKQFIFAGSIIIGATLALAFANADNDEYDALEDWDKDTYWHFWIDGEHWRIPKPFEVGAIFATMPERAYRLLRGQDTGGDFADAVARMFVDTFAVDVRPQLLKPMIEGWANRNSFSDRDIIPASMQDLLPEAQYSARTTETARILGRAIPDSIGDLTEKTVGFNIKSPMIIDHLIRGYLGEMGMYVAEGSDVLARAVGDYAPKPSTRVSDYPVVSRFYRGDDPRTERFLQDFYDRRREVEQVVQTVRRYQLQGDVSRARELLEDPDNREKLKLRTGLQTAYGAIVDITALMRQVQDSRNLSPERKREMLDRLTRQRNRVARLAVNAAPATANILGRISGNTAAERKIQSEGVAQ